MTITHRLKLPQLMRHLNLPMVAVEIGVAEGNFSRDLLVEGIEKLYSVDNWGTIDGQKGDGGSTQLWHDENYKKALQKLVPFGGRSIILKGMANEMSQYVPDNSLGLLYLDGDHSYKGVSADLIHWCDKVVLGGIISTHDYLNSSYGVSKAFNDFCRGRYSIIVMPENKDEDAGAYFIKK